MDREGFYSIFKWSVMFQFEKIDLSLRQSISFKRNDCTVLDLAMAFWIPYHMDSLSPSSSFSSCWLQTLHLSIITPCASFNIERRGAKMTYCAYYKGHKPFLTWHQRGNHPFSPFSTLSSFSLLLSFSLPLPCLSQNLQCDDIEACWVSTSYWRPFGARASWFLDFVFHALWRSSRVTHADDRYLHVHLSSPPLIFDTCIHDPNILDACIGDGCSLDRIAVSLFVDLGFILT